MEWQPISTAPKNQRILLLRDRTVVCGAYDVDKYAVNPKPYWSHDLERLNGLRDARANPPTHWMPLPSLPGDV